MHIGGYHVFAGLFYVVVCAAITVFWAILFYILWVVLVRVIYRFRYQSRQNMWIAGQGDNPEETLRKPTHPLFNRRLFVKITLFSLVFNVLIYASQRTAWMGDGNTHYRAKEYWVAGQVVYVHRRLLGKLLHPENIIIQPYTILQNHIYRRGINQLPEDDGERYVWNFHWFLYPYARALDRPYLVGDKKLEPRMVALLDSSWDTMQGMAGNSYADKQMEKKYLLGFPFVAQYYATYQGHYTGGFSGSGKKTGTSSYYSNRNRQLLSWIDGIYERWIEKGYRDEIWAKHPSVASYQQHVASELVHRIALWLPTEGTFSCDHPIMLRMLKQFEKNMSADPEINAILNLADTNKKQAAMAYRSAVYITSASAGNYLLADICGYQMPAELYHIVEKGSVYSSFLASHRVERVFEKELQPLLTGEGDHVQ
jgi:hypothetical protein